MSSLPNDPSKNRTFAWITTWAVGTVQLGTGWSYRYIAISKNGKVSKAVVIMAGTEEAWSSSNYIYNDLIPAAVGGLVSTDDYDAVRKATCKSISRGNANNLPICEVDKNKDALRYIYIN
jgi:hypothetical protein